MNFREFVASTERSELARQAAEDMALHQKAPNDSRFNAAQNNMLAADVPWKQRFRDLMEKPRIEPQDIVAAEKLRDRIQLDRKSHTRYLNTNDRAHHQKWIQRYGSWLNALEKIIRDGPNN